MKQYAIALTLALTALIGISQPTQQVSIPIQQAELIRRDLERCKVSIQEVAILEQENTALRQALDSSRVAVQNWQQAAGAQEAAAGLRAQQLEACKHLALETEKTNRAKLWKTRAIAAGGWLVAAVFGYLAVSN